MGGYNIGVKRQSLYKKGGENERNMMEMKVEFNLAKQMKMLQLKIFHLIQKAKDKERDTRRQKQGRGQDLLYKTATEQFCKLYKIYLQIYKHELQDASEEGNWNLPDMR